MRKTGPIVVAFGDDEDLSLVFQPPEGGGVKDAIPITLKRGAIVRLILWKIPAAGIAAPKPIWSEGLGFELFQSFARDHGRQSLMIAAIDVNKALVRQSLVDMHLGIADNPG